MKEEKNLKTIQETATILGISAQAIRGWKITHPEFLVCVVPGKVEKIDLEKFCRFLYEWKESESTKAEDTNDNISNQLKEARLEKMRLDIDIQKGSLVDKERYLETERERLQTLKSVLLQLPEKLAPELGLEHKQKEVLKSSLRSTLVQLKGTFESKSKQWEEFINGI